jgi:hypothetical protein
MNVKQETVSAHPLAMPLTDPAVQRRFIRKAGAMYGLVVALGFALFFWLPDALLLRETGYSDWWIKLVLGLCATIPVTAVIGWLAASARWSGLNVLIWIAGGIVLAWIGGHIQFEGVSWLARLTDLYPSERLMYPFSEPAGAFTGISMVVGAGAGLIIGVIGLVAAERAWDASTPRYGFSPKSLVMLGLCLPALLVLGLLADHQINSTTRSAMQSVHQIIETVRDPNADLVRARLAPTARYRDRMSPNYRLYWSSINEDLTRLTIDVQFDSGLLLRCPVMLDNVSLCTDLSEKLNGWMTQMLTVEGRACADCNLAIDPAVRQWLTATVPTLGKLESMALLEHHGGWLYMRAKFDSGRQVDCRFSGDQPITVDMCTEVK